MTSSHQTTADECMFNGDEREAMVFYTRIMVEEPERTDVWLLQILYLLGQRQWTEAASWISRAQSQFPGNMPEWSSLKQVVAAIQGQPDEAWNRLGRIEEQAAGNWIVLLSGAAVLAMKKGHARRAATCVRECIAKMPRENLTFAMLAGGVLESCGHPAGALEFFRLAAKLRPDCAYALYRCAVILDALNRPAESRRELLGAEMLAGDNMRLRKRISLLQPKTRWQKFVDNIFDKD